MANSGHRPRMFRTNDRAYAPFSHNGIDPCISGMERMLVTDAASGDKKVVTRAELLEMSREKTRRLMQK